MCKDYSMKQFASILNLYEDDYRNLDLGLNSKLLIGVCVCVCVCVHVFACGCGCVYGREATRKS